MTDVTIFGPAPSSYVRTARMVCVEKGVSYELSPVELKSRAHLELHPYGRVPILRHGSLQLFETSAIARYLDEAFDGPSLLPETASARAQMEQWISCLNCYMYDDMIRRYALQYLFPQGAGGEPDRATIDAAVPDMQRDVRLLERALADGSWLAGERLSLADLFVAPVIATVAQLPEATKLLADAPRLAGFMESVQERESFRQAHPPDLLR